MTADKEYCYRVEYAHDISISSKFRYVVAKNMEDACKRVKESLGLYENILDCKLMGEML
jgi:hypothetical protein